MPPSLRERIRLRLESWLLRRWFGSPASPADWLDRCLLLPLSGLTGWVSRRRRAAVLHLASNLRPAVVVVGNLVVGGTGKTPLVAELARTLTARGWRVGIIARGHRAHHTGPRLVTATDDARDQGDEPVLLARASAVPVACALRRAQALALLIATHPEIEVVLSDDALQHPGLARTLEIAVFDERGAGNGRLLPAGPLREPLAHLAGMDALVWRLPAGLPDGIAPAPAAGQPAAAAGWPTPDSALSAAPLPDRRFAFRLGATEWHPVGRGGAPARPDRAAGMEVPPRTLSIAQFAQACRGRRVHALAGIAQPERFFALARDLGLSLERTIVLPDHGLADAALLPPGAEVIIMTAKDAVKFESFDDPRCWFLEVRAHPDPALVDWLEDRLRGSSTD
ncbi:MAG: tetraacyldisaccharide 4'-kinase [Betaproteobacteria bacterium]|nr:tetraacyldisaccharide 4'-kinase [Betaproteobacteria bacterium]